MLRHVSHDFSHPETPQPAASHTWKLPGPVLTNSDSQNKLELRYGMQSEIDIMFFYDGEQHYLLRSLRDGHTTTKHNVTYRGKTWDTMLTMWH